MFSDLHQYESYFAAQRPPQGGVAPLRHDLQRHLYMERQRRLDEDAHGHKAFATTQTVRAMISRFVTNLASSHESPKAGHYKLSR